MSFYYPLYFESSDTLTLKYDTLPEKDIESILQSIVAYKKMLQKTATLLVGDYTEECEKNYPEIIITIDKYYKGSDVFDVILKLVPENMQKGTLLTSAIVLGIGSMIFTTNQILDLYIKLDKITEKSQIETEFENFKKEVNNKIEETNIKNNETYKLKGYEIPVSYHKVIDYTLDDYNLFIKPLKQGSVKSISIIKDNQIIREHNIENSMNFNMELINEKTNNETYDVQFTRVDIKNKKSWRVVIPSGEEVKAEIKDKLFFKKIEKLEYNPVNENKKFKVNVIEYWQREKGQEILELKKIDILNVDYK